MSRARAVGKTLGQLLPWLRQRRLLWLAPLVFLLVALGGILALAAAHPALSPFVYLLF